VLLGNPGDVKPVRVERIQCEGKLQALHQVSGIFLEIGLGDEE
jgi:hypothetical protein